MNIYKGLGDFFALDIGIKSIRVVQLSKASQDQWKLEHVGYAGLDPRVIASDSPESRKKLGNALMSTVGQSGIRTKDVAISLPANKTFATVIEVPVMSDAELRSTLKYQADQYIPMPLDDAKIDWAKLGPSPSDPKKQEILLASTAQDYVEGMVEMIDSLGFNVIAAEPDSIAMTRALLPAAPKNAHVVIDISDASTNIVVTVEDRPVLVRTLPIGLRSLVNAIVTNLNVKEDQATQFVIKFGLAPDRLEGQVFRSIESVLDNFVSEIIKSVKFFQSKYATESIAKIHLSGYAGVIPMLAEYIGAKAELPTEVTSPWHKVAIPESYKQTILATEYEFATAVGLAQRSNQK